MRGLEFWKVVYQVDIVGLGQVTTLHGSPLIPDKHVIETLKKNWFTSADSWLTYYLHFWLDAMSLEKEVAYGPLEHVHPLV